MVVKINKICIDCSLVDGPGLRTLVFFQGCDLRCPFCQNKAIWGLKGGQDIEVDELVKILESRCVTRKITITGGEPLMQVEALKELVRKLKDFDFCLYTGHERKDVPEEIIKYLKYLKTGPYIHSKRTTTMRFVGSSNQKFEVLK